MATLDAGKSLKIVGFHGTSSGGLRSIGTHKVPAETAKSVGPYGGPSGFEWDDGKHGAIKQVKVEHSSAIHSITTEYYDNGTSAWSGKHGGLGGMTDVITLDHPNEFLTSVSGTYALVNGLLVLLSLFFKSNTRTFGPYGATTGTSFSSPNGKIIGFFGKSGIFVDSLGAHMLVVPDRVKSVGPLGGPGGFDWDDGEHTAIKKIRIRYAMVIDSIVTEYDDAGTSTWSARHGGVGGTSTETIDLDDPNEYLISISGYQSTFNGFLGIVSLTFQSNKRTYGPYGRTIGTNFTLSGGKIIGLFGKSGIFLDSIGVHMLQEPVQSLGPYGGVGGSFWDDGKHTSIKQINLTYDKAIHSITTEYDDNGISSKSAKHGITVGGFKETITIKYPDEYLVSVSGNYSTYKKNLVIVSIAFQTNKRVIGPYGNNSGTYFSLSSPGGKIVGFMGKSGTNLDSIGVYVTPVTTSSNLSYIESFGGQSVSVNNGGWNDTVDYDRVRKITVGPSDKGIQYVSFVVEKNGKLFAAQGHGTKPAQVSETELQSPDEFLTSVSGYYDTVSGNITSLKFQTNKRTIGPYGTETGTPF